MFNKKDASLELAASMESNLITRASEKHNENINKFAAALEHLNSVADIFDQLGFRKEAEATTILLEIVAAKKSKKKNKKTKKKTQKSKKHDSATKGLSSEKMEGNLKEKGWVFNADDISYDDEDNCDCSLCMDANFASDPYEKDENEQDLARAFHQLTDEEDDRDNFEDEIDMGGFNRPTLKSTPVAKRPYMHQDNKRENEEEYWNRIKKLID